MKNKMKKLWKLQMSFSSSDTQDQQSIRFWIESAMAHFAVHSIELSEENRFGEQPNVKEEEKL